MRLVRRTEIEKPEYVYNLHVKNNNNYVANDVVVSNCHSVKAKMLGDLLKMAVNAKWRFGFTGTMPHSVLDQYQVVSYLGPVLKEYGSVGLAKLGYVAKCKINMVHVEYNNKPKGDYNEIKDWCFNNRFRQGLIKNVIKQTEGNILLLVGKVEDEGEALKRVLSNDTELSDYDIEFLSGKDSATERERWRKYMDTSNRKIITIAFGDNEIQVPLDEDVPLTNGSTKKACNITEHDDVDDDWIYKNVRRTDQTI